MLFGKYASRRSEARFPDLWDGLVGAWCPSITGPSGVRLFDLSGRNNTGTLTNMDPATDWVRNSGRYSIDFDGVDDLVSIGSLNLGTVHSVSFWWYMTTNDKVVIGGAFSPQSYVLYPAISQGFYYQASGSYGLTSVDNSAWQNRVNHSVVTRNGTTVTWTHNGVKYSPVTLSLNNALTVSTFGAFSNGSFFFQGWLDSIGMWNRVLSDSEIRCLKERRTAIFEPVKKQKVGTSFSAAWARRQALVIGGGLQ